MSEKMYEYCEGNRIEIKIPEGFYFKKGNVEEGLVVENKVGDAFVRIPPGYTADGLYIRGFWVSAYNISKGEDGEPHSVSGEYPWTRISFYEASEVAKNYGGALPSKEEYNRICMWLVHTHAATFEEVFENGKGMGNYSKPYKLEKNGSNPSWTINNIDCFWGNAFIWTTERSELYKHYRIIRGGIDSVYGTDIYRPPASRAWSKPEEGNPCVSFRIVLHDVVEQFED